MAAEIAERVEAGASGADGRDEPVSPDGRVSRVAPSSPSRRPSASLQAIAQCESGDRADAVSPDGKYRGLLQFDQATWESTGATGDPAAASAEEQYRRGAILQQQRGNNPWPTCGAR
ncbi:MAG: transglycosylase family protein [Chloroflexi bacterium]|nr:transglycosylase family protein [Chloroflexota bacterium]